MDYKNSKAGKQADKEVVGGVNAEMAPVQEMDDWEVVTQEDWLRSVKRDCIGKAVVSMLNVPRKSLRRRMHLIMQPQLVVRRKVR